VAVVRPHPDIWKARQFRANNAHARLLAIILAHRQPVDLLTGQKIDTAKALAWSNNKEFHHFFPQAFLKAKKVGRVQINCLANFVMLTSLSNKQILDRAPSEYLAYVEDAAGDRLEDWLTANLISREAFDAAKSDDYATFLNLRSITIQDAVLPLAGWPAESDAEGASPETIEDEDDPDLAE
jgi:hypothetical protein